MNPGALAVGLVATATRILAVSSAGLLPEWASKKIDKQKHPILQKITEVFGKTLQLPMLAILAGLTANLSLGPIGGIFIGSIIILTPLIKEGVHFFQNETAKKFIVIADIVTLIAAKGVNIIGLSLISPPLGVGLAALTASTLCTS